MPGVDLAEGPPPRTGFIGQCDMPGTETIRAYFSCVFHGRNLTAAHANVALADAPYQHITGGAVLCIRADRMSTVDALG
jgi:hypothetical protein